MLQKLLFLVLFVALIGCEPHLPSDIASIVRRSGNKSELNGAIEYFKNDKDTLKLQALYFLIRNMGYHGANMPVSQTNYSFPYDYLDTLQRFRNNSIAPTLDSIYNSYLVSGLSEYGYFTDVEIIPADYLIDNIENAFAVWRKAPWARQVSFADFCEYILPYRCDQYPLTYNRSQLLKMFRPVIEQLPDSADIYTVVARVNNYLIKYWKYNESVEKYYYNVDLAGIVRSRTGTCSHEEVLKTQIYRALGIPCAIDFYTAHGLNVILMPDGSHWSLTSFNNPLPGAMPLPNYVPKVFRKNFAAQSGSLAYIEKNKALIPPFFQSPCISDATADYLSYVDTVRVAVDPGIVNNSRYLFLCFADMEHDPAVWVATDWCKYSYGKSATFKHIRQGHAFIVCTYSAKVGYVPVSDAFTLACNGRVVYRKPDFNTKEKVKVFSKYILQPRIDGFSTRMVGGLFKTSASVDWADEKVLAEISINPGQFTHSLKLTQAVTLCGFRYCGPAYGYCNVAEIQLFYKGKNVTRNGNPKSLPADSLNAARAFDNMSSTFFESGSPDKGWVGLIFPGSVTFDSLTYLARTGTNMIEYGKKYELKYWDKEWLSFGTEVASNNFIVFDGAPENALFWLRSTEGGKEERAFTYEGNRQVWW